LYQKIETENVLSYDEEKKEAKTDKDATKTFGNNETEKIVGHK